MRGQRAGYKAAASVSAAFLSLALGACSWTPPNLEVDLSAKRSESTQILAADGSVLAILHATENREPVRLDKVPEVMRRAIIDVEDPAFYDHKGVDYRALIRSVWNNIRAGAAIEGGSTITQQFLKNTQGIGAPRNSREKIREANLAVQLEKRYSKDQILEAYLNTIYFGRGAYGIQAAAKTWFDKDASQIGLPEAVFLAGVVQAPSLYDPEINPDQVIKRRDTVLDRMLERHHVTKEDADKLRGTDVSVRGRFETDRFASPYFVDYVARFVATDPAFGATESDRYQALYAGGLRIHSTLDPEMQAAAEDAVRKVLPDPADPYAALVAIDPHTGAIRAMVGGRDYFSETDPVAKFNLAVQGRRSTGSSFKPFVLAAALLGGTRPTTVFEAPPTLDLPDGPNAVWHVENYEGRATGNVNLIEATVSSVNTAYANLMSHLGPARVIDIARQMGITSELPEVPSIALGAARVSALEMASAYGTLANNGLRIPPRAIEKVTDRDGKVVWQPENLQAQALPPEVAALETAILTQVVDRGTGVGARIGRPAAGKTGTGQDHRDAWFIGYTPDLVASVWVGFPQAEIPMVPPTTRETVLGGTYPASIWALFTSQALVDTPVSQFPPAPNFNEGASAGPMPSYVGHPADEAVKSLQRRGFRPRLEKRYSRDYPPGRVIGSEPPPGASVGAGAEVILYVSTTEGRPVTVPDLGGLDTSLARARLSQSGLVAEVVRQWPARGVTSNTTPGTVWDQDPVAGAAAQPGSTVYLYVNP